MTVRANPNLFVPATQATAPTWPSSGEADELLRCVTAQAATIHQQLWLLVDYQENVLDAAQAPPPAHATLGVGSGTNLVLTGTSGVVVIGSAVAGTNIPANTTIVGQQSGPPGGDGTYTTSVATTANGPLTFTPGGGPSAWPVPQDAPTLNAILTAQTAVIRNQTALIQQYQDLLNISQTPVPAGGT
jgi:hypothetical protein